LKVDFWDIDEMANMITSVMLSDSLRDELWSNAYQEYQKMSWHDASHKVKRVYESHMNGVTA
jgi:hypothetical protein